MDIPEIRDLLEDNCGNDLVLIQVVRQFFNIENSPKKGYDKEYEEVIRQYYDKR